MHSAKRLKNKLISKEQEKWAKEHREWVNSQNAQEKEDKRYREQKHREWQYKDEERTGRK